jgi:two-component sensor histidine kinase
MAIGYIEIANKAADYGESDTEFLEGAARLLASVLVSKARNESHESELSVALAAKAVLLQEVHHRVKNNLQIISSLLSLQADSLPSGAQAALEKSQRRVRSMALIHEQLYTNGDVGRLDFKEYVKSLTAELFGAFAANSGIVRLRLDLDSIVLDMHQSAPCGLILNELVTNSLKYAFPNSRAGEILVSLHRGSGNIVTLQVADNGIGMTPGLDWKESKTLGLRIVNILTRQLGGSLHLEPGEGTDFTVSFARSEE